VPDLVHVTDLDEGLSRVGSGRRVRYLDPSGARVTDAATLERIRSIAIPPAWTEVWICPDPLGHLQAVGRDARRRKQYRYHPDWRRRRDVEKHARVLRLARRLPRIRRVVERDLGRPGLPREKVLALIVRLLELTSMRVGNRAYERLNGSFGLTTMHDRHARVTGSRVRFRFRGKGGKVHEVGLRDRRLARLVGRVQELPGQRLFEYEDEDGERREIRSEDVNDYLRAAAGVDVSAKDLRTWSATVWAFRSLRASGPAPRPADERRAVNAALDEVAARLGNTRAVARSSYVDPLVIDAWRSGAVGRVRVADPSEDASGPPSPGVEAAVRRLLARQVAAERRGPGSARSAQGARHAPPLSDRPGRTRTSGRTRAAAPGSAADQARSNTQRVASVGKRRQPIARRGTIAQVGLPR
jgi:DNA topoisomerase-1